MLDVHPPHTPTHSWRDFLVHIATITVGLLIAVGLEQTVETVRRAEERRTLVEAMHQECRENVEALDRLLDAAHARLQHLDDIIDALHKAPAEGGYVNVEIPLEAPRMHGGAHTPSRSTWAAAKASGKVALLPDNLTQVYDRVDFEGAQHDSYLKDRNDTSTSVYYFGRRMGQNIMPGAKLRLTVAQRDELETLFVHTASILQAEEGWGVEWKGASQSVLDGATTRTAVLEAVDRAVAAHEWK